MYFRLITLLTLLVLPPAAGAAMIFEKYSPYHNVQVIDEGGMRMLSFNGTRETRMSIANPLQGHFEYTEYFHMPWVWNTDIRNVLMIGLGGGSTQRSFLHFYKGITVDTVEIDPVVVDVAKRFFHVVETNNHRIFNEDGRVFLRRSPQKYDLILMDAYTATRYGSSIPPHLTTKEFFELANERLSTNGVLAYNVIGQTQGWRADIVGGLYRTLKEVFPQVYYFPATSSRNVVIIATRSPEPYDATRFHREGAALIRTGQVRLPTFSERLRAFVPTPLPSAAQSPVLTDDRAPVEGLMRESGAVR